MVSCQEAVTSCKAAEAASGASLHSSVLEASLWEASALVGAVYAVVQHEARPLWVRRFETPFPLDRFVA